MWINRYGDCKVDCCLFCFCSSLLLVLFELALPVAPPLGQTNVEVDEDFFNFVHSVSSVHNAQKKRASETKNKEVLNSQTKGKCRVIYSLSFLIIDNVRQTGVVGQYNIKTFCILHVWLFFKCSLVPILYSVY